MKTLITDKRLFGLFLLLSTALACSQLRPSSSSSTSSPTSALKAFYEAQKNKKDVAAYKKTLSKGSLAMLEQGAKERNKTLDEALKEALADPTSKTPTMPETRNEKIDGDTATLEVQDDQSKRWSTMYFVKEDGDWKVALDKTLTEGFKNLQP
jgi:spore germination protein GerM